MKQHELLKSAAKTYTKLPPEFKIPYALYLYFLLIVFKLRDILALSFTKLGSIQKHSKLTGKKFRRTLKHRLHLRKQKKSQQSKSYFSLPIFLKMKYFFLGSLFSLLFGFLPILTIIFLQDLPHPRELTLRPLPQTTKIYDRNKILLYEIYANQNRTIVPLTDIPRTMRLATLAIEDKNFYSHPGFDITSIIRAFKENVQEGKPLQGGSTLTQQLIKSSLLNSEKKLSRKVKEVVLAFWAERQYTKDQILEMYFNQVPYGGTAWGVEAASEVYFGKHVKNLTLGESAFLAGITQAPSTYSPYAADESLWKRRQKDVLSRMVALNYISQKQADAAAKEKLQFERPEIPLRAPHFVMYIKNLLIRQHGLAAVEKGGLTVITSLDLKKQEMAQKIVADEVAKASFLNLSNGAALITNPKNGDILAMVGSRDFSRSKDGNVNVTTALRQPGSTVKVITYSAALMQGVTAATVLDDTPTTFAGGNGAPSYTPVNYDGRYFGKVSLRFALANSLNVTAVKTLQKVGVSDMVSLARDMGITSWDNPERYGLAVTLGGAEATMLDMATVFGTLSNGGNRVDLNPILSITDYRGNVLEVKKETNKTRVLKEGVAFIITDILSDNRARSAAFGPNSQLVIPGHTVAVKTGTSDNKRDNWAIGYTNDVVVSVWVGNNDNSPMSQRLASGLSGASPIWQRVMINVLSERSTAKRAIPEDITYKPCFGRMEYFIKGTENSLSCGNFLVNPRVYSAN